MQTADFWIFATLEFNENYVLHVVLLIPWSVADSLDLILRAKISQRNFEIQTNFCMTTT